jgi:hypothetical protein
MNRPLPLAVRSAAVLVLSTAGCVRVSTTRLSTASYPTVPPDSVHVYATQAPPAYTEVAVLRATRVWRSGPAALAALREQAGRLGADGLLLLNTRGGSTGRGAVSGVIVGGGASGGIFMGDAKSDVDEFARAVAIRLLRPGADSAHSTGGPRR